MVNPGLGAASEQLTAAQDYGAFEEALVALNGVIRQEPVASLDGGMTWVREVISPRYFAHPSDKQTILKGAFELAQTHSTDGRALQLGAAVLAVHPFKDRNGGVSRVVHAAYLGWTDVEIVSSGIAKYHGVDEADDDARQLIDLAPPPELKPYVTEQLYKTAELERVCYLTRQFVDEQAKELHTNNRARLTDPDAQADLDRVFTVRESGYVICDLPSLEFGLNALRANGQELITTRAASHDGEERHIADVPRTLKHLDEQGLTEFLRAVWQHRRLRAETIIGCLAAGALELITTTDWPQPQSFAAHYTRLTKNLMHTL